MLAVLKLARGLNKNKKAVFQRTRIPKNISFLKVRCHLANTENNSHTKRKKKIQKAEEILVDLEKLN